VFCNLFVLLVFLCTCNLGFIDDDENKGTTVIVVSKYAVLLHFSMQTAVQDSIHQ